MKKIDDYWLMPRTKAGTEEMRERLKDMRKRLQPNPTDCFETKIDKKILLSIYNEHFTFNWE